MRRIADASAGGFDSPVCIGQNSGMPHDPYTSAGARLAAIAAGQTDCATLMQATLARIERVNPALNAIVSQRDAGPLMAEARAADRARREGRPQGLLAGLPMAVKDLAATAGLTTTLGSPWFRNHVPRADALMVSRLRAAGALIIGKTNTPEFGLGSQTYNRVFGATGCAFDPARTAGGSSGGAAAAVGAGLLDLADGSDMMGSLRNPAAYNHIFGLRPTPGRVPGLPAPDVFSPVLGTEGPMARSAADLARLLVVQSGADIRHPQSLADDPADLWPAPADCNLRGLRIGWLADWQGTLAFEPGIQAVCEESLANMGQHGAEIEPVAAGFDSERLWQAWLVLRQAGVAARLGALYDDPAARIQLKPEACWEIEQGRALSAQDVQQAQQTRSAWHACLCALFERFDTLALPSAQVFAFDRACHWPAQINGVAMDTYHRWMQVVVPGSLSAGPTLALPAGFDRAGRAMGLQLMAPARAERRLLAIARGYEQARPELFARRPDEALYGRPTDVP